MTSWIFLIQIGTTINIHTMPVSADQSNWETSTTTSFTSNSGYLFIFYQYLMPYLFWKGSRIVLPEILRTSSATTSKWLGHKIFPSWIEKYKFKWGLVSISLCQRAGTDQELHLGVFWILLITCNLQTELRNWTLLSHSSTNRYGRAMCDKRPQLAIIWLQIEKLLQAHTEVELLVPPQPSFSHFWEFSLLPVESTTVDARPVKVPPLLLRRKPKN